MISESKLPRRLLLDFSLGFSEYGEGIYPTGTPFEISGDQDAQQE